MTSRERLLKAINHEVPDRVPIDLGGNQTGIHRFAYEALLKQLGIRDEVAVMDAVQQLAAVRGGVGAAARRHPLHRREGGGFFSGANRAHSATGGCGATCGTSSAWSGRCPRTARITWTFRIIRWPARPWPTWPAIPFPRATIPAGSPACARGRFRLRKETPYAVASGISGVVYEICWYMRGLQQWFMDLATDPEFCGALLDQTLRFWLDWFRLFLDEVGDLVDVIMIGDDLAGQSGPLFRPETYRAVVKPRQKRLVQYIRSRTAAKIWYHTCGSCMAYIPDLLDNGVDILNPVQISAQGMDPAALKATFGDRLVFWGGGIDSQHVLPSATPEMVRQHVCRNMEAWKPGGGYVFNNVHNIQAGVPPENVVALFDAAYECGGYPC